MLNSNEVEADFKFPPKGLPEFDLRGENETFGQYSCFGEVRDMKTGDALGVLTDQDGDQIVGVVTLTPHPDQPLEFHFSWRASVQLSNGRRYVNTGKFANETPPGLVVISIWLFIGVLLEEWRQRL